MNYSIVIPLYNEEANICQVVNEIKNSAIQTFEIIVVNDGSNDSSLEECLRLHEEGLVNVVSFDVNRGKTFAIVEGIKRSKYSNIIMMDADGQHNPCYIPQFLDILNSGYELVTGFRINRANSFTRNKLSTFYNWFLRQTLDLPYHDYNSGFNALTKECAEIIFSEHNIERYSGVHRYAIPIAIMNGFKVKELEIIHRHRLNGKSFISFSKHFYPLVKEHLTFMSEYGYALRNLNSGRHN